MSFFTDELKAFLEEQAEHYEKDMDSSHTETYHIAIGALSMCMRVLMKIKDFEHGQNTKDES